MSAGRGNTPNTSKQWSIPITSDTKSSWMDGGVACLHAAQPGVGMDGVEPPAIHEAIGDIHDSPVRHIRTLHPV